MKRLLLSFCIALLVAPKPSFAQGAADARTVLAAILDQQGRPIVGVGLDDVVVSEGSQPREVLDVHVADYPLAVVIDDRPSASTPFDAVVRAAQRFVSRVGERPIALVRLTDGEHPIVTLDDDRAVLLERLGAAKTSATQATPPLDTIARTAARLKETGAPFSAIVVIAASGVDASALVRGELLPQIIESGAAVHVVQAQNPQEQAASDPAEQDLLRVIAGQTRGQFTTIYSTASYEAALDRLADRLAVEMMIQYLAPPGTAAGDVRVGVRMPGSRVIGLGVK